MLRDTGLVIDNVYKRRRPVREIAAGLAVAALLLSGCSDSTTKASENAKRTEQETKEAVNNPDKKVSIMPGVIVADSGVRVRLTPAKINTLNIAMITGNEAGAGPIALRRPVIVENLNRGENDPKYWAGGKIDYEIEGEIVSDFLWVAIDDETKDKFTYYALSGQGVQFCEGQLEGLYGGEINDDVFGNLTINPDGYAKSVADAYRSQQSIDDLLAEIEEQGYRETALC